MNHNILFNHFHLMIIFIVICYLNLTYGLSDSNTRIAKELFTDVSVHEGYDMKYSFKDHNYIDILFIPKLSSSEWLAIILDKSETGGNRISLRKYNGDDFDKIENAPLEVGNCKKINSIEYSEYIFITVSKCDVNTSTTDIMVIPEFQLSLITVQTLPHAFVEDAQFWKNSTGALNLAVLTRQKMVSRSPGVLYHYVLDNQLRIFKKIGFVKSTDPRSVTIFDINQITYLAVANYHDIASGFIKSNIYVQDLNTGRLIKHQELTTKGTVSLTYICIDGTTKKEHFLLAANNRKLKGQPESKNITDTNFEESILFKWDQTNFIPFQTLLVRLPSPWILVQDIKNVPILLTWSYVDGIISYQYDGWRFKRTAIEQKDITNESHDFVSLRPEFIAGEILFTIFNTKVGAKRKYFIPVYRNNATTRINYRNKEEWCENAYISLQHAWNEFSPHNQYLMKLNSISKKGPERIVALFDLIFGPNTSNGIKQRKSLEVMSLIGPSNLDNIQSKSSHQECTADINMTKLPGIIHVVDTKNGFFGLDQSGNIWFYPISQWMTNENNIKGTPLNTFKAGTKISQLQTMKLCHHLGLYVEVEYAGKLFGQVYEIHDNNKMTLKRAIPLKGSREVKPKCIENRDCFLIMPNEGDPTSICTIHCDHLNNSFSCDFKSQEEIFKIGNESIIVGASNNTIFKLIMNNEGNLRIKTSIKDVKNSSKILLKAINQQLIILIFDEEGTQICRFHEEDQNNNLICHNGKAIPLNYQHIELGFINKEAALFIGTHKQIWMTILSSNHSTKLLDLENISYKSFKPFQIENLNFIVLKEEGSSTIIKVAHCKP